MIGILFVFILFIKLTGVGSWKIILNQILSAYIDVKRLHPNLSDKDVFMRILDERYKTERYRAKKEKAKRMIQKEIEEGRSILNQYSLPILIYISLIIEKNKILNRALSAQEVLTIIRAELRRQGFFDCNMEEII
ncbi:hypothetical protein EQM06_03410 [Aminipila luticellarii]|uniref:Uncharacterized protein n=2 Tax=Aminipila luticellarii TaxID=2507160 RepID=A0A410PTU9_9FIRM|nr:hypothetical protein EQM06_03410 [Aminipila luticellarii]